MEKKEVKKSAVKTQKLTKNVGRGKKQQEEAVTEDILETLVEKPATKVRGKKMTNSIEKIQQENGDVLPVSLTSKANRARGKKIAAAAEEEQTIKNKRSKIDTKEETPVNAVETKKTATKRGMNNKTALKDVKKVEKAAVEEIEAVTVAAEAVKISPKRSKRIKRSAEPDIVKETKATKVVSAAKRSKKQDEIEVKVDDITIRKSRSSKKVAEPISEVVEEVKSSGKENAEKKTRIGRSAKANQTNGQTVPKVLKNATNTNFDKESFALDRQYKLKIASWNVAGLRSLLKKDGFKFLEFEEPDIFCLQEVKCEEDQLPAEVARLDGFHRYWLCMPGGYAGVAIYSRIMPIHVEYGIGNKSFDENGRIITAEYEKFYLVNVYVPNSGRKLVNLEKRMEWEELFRAHVQRLDNLKAVIVCGDMNVSHQEIDLANPKANVRNAGFTTEERDKMSALLAAGFVDTFRHLYPKRTGAYTFWTYMGNARTRNVGWRLDYFLVSKRFLSRVVDQVMRPHVLGSDHCPLTLFLNV